MVMHFNENAEKALIALAFDKPEILTELDVNAEAFYSLQHQTIWRTMLCMMANGKTPDVVTVAESLMGQIDIEQFLALNESVRTWGNGAEYAEIVNDLHQLRTETEILNRGLRCLERGDSCAADVMGDLAAVALPAEKERELHELCAGFIADCESGNYGHFAWWCNDWTQRLGKLSSDLMILHAPRSTGKTAMMLQWIFKAHKSGHRAPLASIEMLRKELVGRLISHAGQLDTFKMRCRGHITPNERQRATDAGESIQHLNLCIRDRSMSIDDLCVWALREQRRAGADVIFIDNLLSISDGGKQYASKTIMYDQFIRRLRDLRDQLKVPVVLLAHPNAEGGIAWSKDVENFADIILFLKQVPPGGLQLPNGDTIAQRHDIAGKHIAAVFQKNRNGICPVVASLDFVGETQTFTHLRWEV